MTFGRFKFIAERLKGYATWVSQLMIVDMWIRLNGIPYWVAVLVLILLAVGGWTFIDKRRVLPEERIADFDSNPRFVEMLELLRDMDERRKEK